MAKGSLDYQAAFFSKLVYLVIEASTKLTILLITILFYRCRWLYSMPNIDGIMFTLYYNFIKRLI
jgi:hypothetical protein